MRRLEEVIAIRQSGHNVKSSADGSANVRACPSFGI